jgi:hypothetical protein
MMRAETATRTMGIGKWLTDEDDNEPLDVTDNALGLEDGEGDVDEINLLGFADF